MSIHAPIDNYILMHLRQYLVDSEEEGHTDDNQRARCFGEIGEEQERREWRMTLLKTHYMHM